MSVPKFPFETEWVLKAISHELRREILFLIANNSSQSYTAILEQLELSTGKLNFHLKQLAGLIEKQNDGSYILTSIGKESIDILNQVNSITEDKDQAKYLKSITLGTSIKQFQPAPETKKKWYFWIITIYLTFILIPLVIITSVLDLNLLGILTTSQKYSRIILNIIFILGIFFVLITCSCFLAKKYLESINYEIQDTELTINKGLIVRTRAVIPFRTITNLVIKQGPLDLLLGISRVIIQTAGESSKTEPEGKLRGIYYAEDLIEEILNLIRLLDPPSYLREKGAISTTPKNISILYSQIVTELKKIDKKLSD
jgi:membrane protein YdbS with pleckstrin-like domain